MQINSINTNLAAYAAQRNIGIASNATAASVGRLSSGNRIQQASDDVAALSIGTSLKTGISTLRTALLNTSQGSALLQVADGALAQVSDILQRQKSIAVQAGSGTLGDTERAFLDAEFQALTLEIDRIAGATNFNGVKLINGALSTSVGVEASTAAASKGSLSTTFVDNIRVGESVIVNGQAFFAYDPTGAAPSATNIFAVGATLADTVSNLAARLNTLKDNTTYNSTIGVATYTADGNKLTASARAGGSLSNTFTFGTGSTAATGASTTGTALVTNTSTTVDITTANTSGFAVGQSIIVNYNSSSAAIDGVAQKDLRGVITSITDGVSLSFTAQAAATASNTNTNTVTFSLDQANGVGESDVNAAIVGSSFNLFATTTGFTSATTAISNATPAAATPFMDGDTFSITQNGNVSNLYTFGTDATLQDLVNGINATTSSSGFSAALVYTGSTYNIRINSANQGNIILNGGTNYYSGAAATNVLTGLNLSATSNNVGLATFGGKSIVSTGYVNLFSGATPVTVASTASATTALVASVAVGSPFLVGGTITATVNGKTTALVNPIASGATIRSLVAEINAGTSTTGVYAVEVTNAGNTASNLRLFFTGPSATAADPIIVASTSASAINATTNVLTTNGLTTTYTGALKGGADDGLAQGGVTTTGTVGDSILQSLGTTKANASILFTGSNATANDYITVGGQAFYFTANTTAAPNEILIGSTLQETINNAVSTLNRYSEDGYALGTTAYELNQINISSTANSLVFTSKSLSAVKTLTGGNSAVSQNLTSGSLVGGTLNNNSTTFGVDVAGIANKDFSGQLQGFTATLTGTANTVDLSIKIGDNTYTAKSVNAVVTSDTRIRFYSDTVGGVNGGYFDVQLKANSIAAFAGDNATAASTIAARMDGAFSSLSFLQSRNVSSYTGTGSISAGGSVVGSLTGSKVSAQFESYGGVNLTSVSITAPSGSTTDAQLVFTINGVEYKTANGIGSKLGANQTYKLVSAEDPNQFVNFTTGDTAIQLDTATKALAVEAALKTAFGVAADGSSAALNFQVGTKSSDSLAISIGDASTKELFSGVKLNVLTSESAGDAVDALDTAIEAVTSIRANVGALQSRFNFAAANIESAIQNQDAARGTLLDTDIASESTLYATAQVKLQAGISVLAQANQQTQALLKLIG